jgi:protein-tyrosine phosphatase
MTGDHVRRRLDDRSLFIGDRRAADPSTYVDARDADYETVLTLSRRREPLTTHHHPLRDGAGNPESAIADAVDTARALHRADGDVLVHCAAGVSRSATVLAATLAVEEHVPFLDGLGIVQRNRERACPNPALRERARAYLQSPTPDPVATDPGRTTHVSGQSWSDETSGSETLVRSVLKTVFGGR